MIIRFVLDVEIRSSKFLEKEIFRILSSRSVGRSIDKSLYARSCIRLSLSLATAKTLIEILPQPQRAAEEQLIRRTVQQRVRIISKRGHRKILEFFRSLRLLL